MLDHRLANGCFANWYFENPHLTKVPRRPPLSKGKGGKEGWTPLTRTGHLLMKLKVPVYKGTRLLAFHWKYTIKPLVESGRSFPGPEFLGWHVWRTKLAREISFKLQMFSRKMLPIFPEMFKPIFWWVRQNPANSRRISRKLSLPKIKNHWRSEMARRQQK